MNQCTIPLSIDADRAKSHHCAFQVDCLDIAALVSITTNELSVRESGAHWKDSHFHLLMQTVPFRSFFHSALIHRFSLLHLHDMKALQRNEKAAVDGSILQKISATPRKSLSSVRRSNSPSTTLSTSSRFSLLISSNSHPSLPHFTTRSVSLRQWSLNGVLATTLVVASLLPHFSSGSEAAVEESRTGVIQYGAGGASLGGQWDLIGHSGVSAMHAVMRPFSDNVLFLERVQASTVARARGTSENGNKGDAFAWSTEFSTLDGSWRSLDVKSNMFCSAGGYLPDGVRCLGCILCRNFCLI